MLSQPKCWTPAPPKKNCEKIIVQSLVQGVESEWKYSEQKIGICSKGAWHWMCCWKKFIRGCKKGGNGTGRMDPWRCKTPRPEDKKMFWGEQKNTCRNGLRCRDHRCGTRWARCWSSQTNAFKKRVHFYVSKLRILSRTYPNTSWRLSSSTLRFLLRNNFPNKSLGGHCNISLHLFNRQYIPRLKHLNSVCIRADHTKHRLFFLFLAFVRFPKIAQEKSFCASLQ